MPFVDPVAGQPSRRFVGYCCDEGSRRLIWRFISKWWRHRIGRFVDVRNVVIFFAAILVMLIGLETQFFNDAGLDGGIRFFLELSAWAAAIQIVGVELAQLGSQLYGKRPSAGSEGGTLVRA